MQPSASQLLPQQQLLGSIPPADLGWLVRYARHCRSQFPESAPPEHAVRQALGRAAWRLLCRTPKERFLSILRNRELLIYSLITYCQRLVERGFAVAPEAILLDFFVTQWRLYLDRPCRVPEHADYLLMRTADRSPQRLREIGRVSNWANEVRLALAAVRQSAWHF